MGLIVSDKKEVLITLRNEPEQKRAHRKWQIPGGGVEFGEKPINALKREMKEELGVEIEALTLIPYVNSSIWKTKKKIKQVFLLCFLCRIKSGKIKLDGVENTDYRWIYPKEISKLLLMPLARDYILAAEKEMKRRKN
ncbi:MAG: ADP-ribose pyrophosphatase [Candidatus Levybacteria bacterium GW2011_GWA2_40_8]|nr:MAG: ADP-ribose pyrophosphatase [Candidatus Levybacteria bacterium GW2011_GWA2_40_8]